MTLASIGIVAGLAAALAATRLLSTMLFGVGPADPAVFCAVATLLATRIDPMIALRCD
jgi:hypothetical protein